MNNGRKKRAAAKAHNIARAEREAYEQDRIEDPEKYQRNKHLQISRGNRPRISSSTIILATLAAMEHGR
jgi:hypothetical protein